MNANRVVSNESTGRRGSSNHARYVGRVGALAVALGIGGLLASAPAAIAGTGSTESAGSNVRSVASASSPAPTRGAERKSAARGSHSGPADSAASKSVVARSTRAPAGSVNGIASRAAVSLPSTGSGDGPAAQPVTLMAAATVSRQARGVSRRAAVAASVTTGEPADAFTTGVAQLTSLPTSTATGGWSKRPTARSTSS